MRIGDWIQTFKGVAFYPFDPRPEEILIEDIAHALSNQCRFTGHVRRFYSVAEHCIRVMELVPEEDKLAALLHDASEAYLINLARPIKHMPELEIYRTTEDALQVVIYHKFGLGAVVPPVVKLADNRMLAVEARDLMGTLLPGWEKWIERLDGTERPVDGCMDPVTAKAHFLYHFRNWCL